ncbi:hypothetical protein Tco_0923397 [Tanacetum coccineum]|uniref:GAG-pre-integrase domain-containing protein n=1 Tax=Tanacetum coccineum TaxID=301880 RepID=A0ABQ5D1W8_9ASTR
MTKSLANKLYLKKKLFTFYMDLCKKLSEHIDEFNKLVGDLANIDERESRHLKMSCLALIHGNRKIGPEAKDAVMGLYVSGKSDHRLSKKEQEEINWLCQKECETGFCYHSEGYTMVLVEGGEEFTMVVHFARNKYHVPSWDREGLNREVCRMKSKVEASVGIQEKESLAQVWHKHLGHITEAGLHELEKREVLRNKGLGLADLWVLLVGIDDGADTSYRLLKDYSRGELKPRAIKCNIPGYPDGCKDTDYGDSVRSLVEVELKGSKVNQLWILILGIIQGMKIGTNEGPQQQNLYNYVWS